MSRSAVRASRGSAAHDEASHRAVQVRAARVTALLLAGVLSVSACTTGGTTAGGPAAAPAPLPSVSPTAAPGPSIDPVGEDASDGDAPAPSSPEPTRSATPTPNPAPPMPTAPPAPTATPEPAPAPPPEPSLLRRRDAGEAVLALQQRLAELGYFITAPDGDFGPATQQAVWALQKAAGLTRDGLVGPETQAALDAGARPTPRTTTGRTIEIDLDRQLLLAVDDGVVTRVINASSGNGERYVALGRQLRAFTPTGDYTVVHQIDAMHESTLELGSMYRPKYFYRGWAVHGSSSIPPWPASHGCVRVSNAAMSWIWDVWGAPLGTRVLVY